MGDVSGMAEKMQSFFLQEVLSQTHCVLKEMLEEVLNWLYQHAPSCFTILLIAHTNVSICYVLSFLIVK